MKAFVTFALGLCIASTAPITFASDIIGSGNVIQQERSVSGIKAVNVSGSGELVLTQGPREELTIEAENNLLPFIISEVGPDGTLRICSDPEHNLHAIEPIVYTLVVDDVDTITISGNTSLEMPKGYITQALKIEVNAAGAATIDINADEVDLMVSDAGTIQGKGIVQTQRVTATGAGKYRGKNIASRHATMEVRDAASVDVDVADDLDVSIYDAAVVGYHGSPRVNANINGQAATLNATS